MIDSPTIPNLAEISLDHWLALEKKVDDLREIVHKLIVVLDEDYGQELDELFEGEGPLLSDEVE